MNPAHLAGKTALVTGSVQGIGLAIAEALAECGARIALHGIAGQPAIDAALHRIRDAGAPDACFLEGDLRDPAAIDQLMDRADEWGGVDVLINNAGIQRTTPFADVSNELWTEILAVNLSAAFFTMRRALPTMAARGYGRVINIASVHGLVASINKAPYVASKFGLVGLSRVAALEYAAAGGAELGGVTVNCICPGWTETPLIEPQIEERAAALGGDRAAATADLLREKQPSLRMSRPAEIGSLVAWFTLPIAHNVTGTALTVDGGWTAQ